MAFSLEILRSLQVSSPKDSWQIIFDHTLNVCRGSVDENSAEKMIQSRDQEIGLLDLFLAGAGWDLWTHFDENVLHTSDAAQQWWKEQQGGRAILILDALSLRELPWLLQGAEKNQLKVKSVAVTGAELPSETTAFAKAIGFGQRSSLANNGMSKHSVFQNTRSESSDMPWVDCEGLITVDPNWIFWHHWPDSRMHELSEPGRGLHDLTKEAVKNILSSEFWSFVKKLATGRNLLITSDHGYAATGLFPNEQGEQAKFLKAYLSSQRFSESIPQGSQSLPPIALAVKSRHGEYFYTLGRRKWKSPAGYPTLAHGGLSVLEVAVPFIEMTAK